jgi:signal peptidase I
MRLTFRTSDPDRSDLIIYYDIPKDTIAAKRVIGLPGDKIELRENVVYVNDVAAEQKVLSQNEYHHVPAENGLGALVLEEQLDDDSHLVTYTPKAVEVSNYGPVVVPTDQYFVLGDHRDNSNDSRYIGFITRGQIKGRIIYGARSID